MRRPLVFERKDTLILLAAVLLSAATLSVLACGWWGARAAPSPAAIAVPPPLPDLCRDFPHAVRDDLVPSSRIDHQVLDRNRTACGWRTAGTRPVSLRLEIVRARSVDEARRGMTRRQDPEGVPLRDVGDEAFIRQDAGAVEIVAREGTLVLTADYSDGGKTSAVQRVAAELLRLSRG
ncbi:hypothetical protein [Actinomadura sp. 9N407]|uniref:hypothetical protein n=1 Tax=Actinomadura sp. 9N407 TaxID=3375154 RepID=UPI0037BD42A2